MKEEMDTKKVITPEITNKIFKTASRPTPQTPPSNSESQLTELRFQAFDWNAEDDR